MNYVFRRKIHRNITVRVSTSVINSAHFLTAKGYRGLVRECDLRRTRHFPLDHMLARVCVRDQLTRSEKLQIAPGMVAMMVRIDHIANGLARDTLHRRDD